MPEDNTKTGQIFDLIPKIMGDIGHVAKDQNNSFQNYNFRGIDDVYNCVGPVLAKYGVHILPVVLDHSVTDVMTTKNKASCRVILKVAYRFTAPDGSYVEAVTIGEAMDTGDKAASKAMSAAMKYAVWQTLCIPTKGAQGDSENDSYERAQPAPQQQPQPQQQAPKPEDAMAKKKAALFATWGAEPTGKAMLALINPDTGDHFKPGEKNRRMAELNELERMLNTGEVK